MDIGKTIATRRKAQHISQEQLSEKADISQGYISSIERGKEKPSLELLEKIAQALDCQLYIDLIPNGVPAPDVEHIASAVTSTEYSNVSEPQAAPTWVTLEQASSITIFTIALEKLRLEKNNLTPAEIKVLQGLIEMYQEEIKLITTGF